MIPRDSLDRDIGDDAEDNLNLFVAKGDIVYNMMRMWQGAFGLATMECMVSGAYVVLQPKPQMNPKFFIYNFGRQIALYLFTSYSYGLTSDRLRLYFKDFSLINFSIPTLPEQTKIADFLSDVDEKLQTLKQKKAALETYKKGLMQKLFSQALRFKDADGKDFPDWEEKTLGEIGEFVGGGTPSTGVEEFWNGEIQWFTPTEIKSDFVSKSIRTITELGLKQSSAKILPVGTILLTTRATIGEAAISLNECTTNQGFQSIVVKEDISNVYVFNWLKENKHELMSRANGSTFPEISKSALEKIKVTLPSLAEQTKIADFLSCLDEKIAVTALALEKLEVWKKGLLQKMFV
jgi:type I restriction enzyme S subunit